MKKRYILIIIVVILIGGAIYLNPLLPIITGYSAKNLASGVFVADRTQASLEETDLNFSFIKMNEDEINWNDRSVTSEFLWGRSKAIYKEGVGCVLVKEIEAEEILDYKIPKVKVLPENPDTIDWPMGDRVSDTIPAGLNMAKLNTAIANSFVDTIPRKGSFAVAVVYKGQLVAENYADGFSAENKYLSWSMAKSFTNALTGIMVKKGMLDINEPMKIAEWQEDDRKAITLNNLMHMNSGLEWNEDYGNNSDVNTMLHKVADMGAYTINKPLAVKPDSLWVYSSGATNVVCKYIRQVMDNDQEYYQLPRKELFNKIGMTSAVFEIDASGTFVGSSYLYATMRDYARFGLLYMNEGNWLGEQILPTGWVDYTTQVANGSNGQYGAFFWLNQSQKDYPDVPKDMYCCRGHDGQYIYIIPSKDLVVVRTGFSKKGEFDYNLFLKEIIAAVE